MRKIGDIKTVGLCPCWDTVCRVAGIEWGDHKVVESTSIRPAGKALNVCRALAWMGGHSTAAGLWGADDYSQMVSAMAELKHVVSLAFTGAPGSTRRNVTVVDTAGRREMHLRSVSELANKRTLWKLRTFLATLVRKGDVCVFAGAMPGEELAGDVRKVVEVCTGHGALTVLDTSGPALRSLLQDCGAWVIKPNVAELCELLGEDVADRAPALVAAGLRLSSVAETVLISRGAKGALAITGGRAYKCSSVRRRKALSTVGCGDYLLAGYLKSLQDGGGPEQALATAVKVATAKAWGLADEVSWPEAADEIEVDCGAV